MLTGKRMKLSSIPLFCPCGSTKEKVRSALKPSISITFKRPAISSRVTARIERIPKASEFSKNNLILSVLPSCNNTFNCDSLIWCFAKAPSKTSSVPEPFSKYYGQSTKLFQRQFVISSQLRPYMSDNH